MREVVIWVDMMQTKGDTTARSEVRYEYTAKNSKWVQSFASPDKNTKPITFKSIPARIEILEKQR